MVGCGARRGSQRQWRSANFHSEKQGLDLDDSDQRGTHDRAAHRIAAGIDISAPLHLSGHHAAREASSNRRKRFMKKKNCRSSWLLEIAQKCTAVLCAVLLAPGEALLLAQSQQATSSAQTSAAKIPPDQLDSLVAPIALYPDPLLAQALAASTYPLEIVQLQQWLEKNKNLKDKALADAVAK